MKSIFWESNEALADDFPGCEVNESAGTLISHRSAPKTTRWRSTLGSVRMSTRNCVLDHIDARGGVQSSNNLMSAPREAMDSPSLVVAISKLAAAGEQAGFTLEQMIGLLDAGLGVNALLELICWRLNGTHLAPRACGTSTHWVC